MEIITPNPEVEVNTPEGTPATGAEQTETGKTEQPKHDVETVDYRQKFIDSSKGVNTLLEQNKTLERELAEARKNHSAGNTNLPNHSNEQPENFYPGFEELDSSEKDRVNAFANAIQKKTLETVNSNPALAYSQKQYNESRWEEAFNIVSTEHPELKDIKSDFKSKYFHPNHVPDNIEDIMKTMAKAELFDKARAIGASEAAEVAQRVQLEDPTGGDNEVSTSRSLAEWQEIAKNPARFASMKSQYDADIASGKLKE